MIGYQLIIGYQLDKTNSVGETLQIMKMGEEPIDPETGISLRGSMTSIGEIQVTQVQNEFSSGCFSRETSAQHRTVTDQR